MPPKSAHRIHPLQNRPWRSYAESPRFTDKPSSSAATDWLRADKALHVLLGIERFPGADTVRFLAVLAEAQCVLQGWLRLGNTSAGRGVAHFLQEALRLVPPHWKIRRVRADSGFFAQELPGFPQQSALHYFVRLLDAVQPCLQEAPA